MVEIPGSKVLVIGGRLNPKYKAHVSATIDHNGLIDLTIHVGFSDSLEEADPAMINFYGVGSLMIDCNLNFHQDVIRLDPRDMIVENEKHGSALEFKAILTEMAFIRSLELLRFDIERRLGNVHLRFCTVVLRKRRGTLKESSPWDDKDASEYFTLR